MRARAAMVMSLMATCGCVAPVTGTWLRPRPVTGAVQAPIAVLRSSSSAIMDEALHAFVEQVSQPVVVFDASGDDDATAAALSTVDPQLILALGSKSAQFAARAIRDKPVVFAMVINYQRLSLNQPNITGIGLEAGTAVEFMHFRMIMPEMKRVLAFYTRENSEALVNTARQELEPLGIELTAVLVRHATDIETGFANHARAADAVWLLNDATIMSSRIVTYLRNRTQRAHIPLICSLSDQFVKEGALMSVSVDFASVGAQAAALARLILEQGLRPADLGVQPPIASQLALNSTTLQNLGIKVPSDALAFVNEWIE